MTDDGPYDDLSPQHAEVRRLLAEARHDEPMPVEVAARLDGVLAGLAQEPGRAAPVTHLATRRRRAAALLLAAAAVVAIGIGVSQVIDTGTGSADSLTTADRDASGDDTGRTAAEDEQAETAPEGAAEGSVAEDQAPLDAEPFARLTRKGYGDEVAALRAQRAASGEPDASDRLSASSAAGEACRSDTWGPGAFVPVRYEGSAAVLVLRRARGDTQVADLFLCGDTEPHRSVTLPAP